MLRSHNIFDLPGKDDPICIELMCDQDRIQYNDKDVIPCVIKMFNSMS